MRTQVKFLLMFFVLFGILGCDTAKEVGDSVADGAKEVGEKVAEGAGDMVEGAKEMGDKVAEGAKDMVESAKDMANIDFGDFDMSGLKDKFTSITDGFKDVSADSTEGLVSKIKDLTGSLDGLGIGNLTGAAKTAVGTAISAFVETVTKALEGISDEGILSKLKPVVESLVEKLNAFK